MKLKAFYVPLLMLLNDVLISIPSPGKLILHSELTFESIRVASFSFAGVVRLLGMPLLLLTILNSIEMHRVRKDVVPFLVPIAGLLGILFFQFLVIPSDAISMHSTGIVRYISWALGYIALLSTLSRENCVKVHHACITILTILFFLLIIQYPGIIATSGYSLGEIIQSYGSDTLKLNGIFAAANEDANGAMTLLPFFLAYTEQQSGTKKWLLRAFAFALTPVMILFNGTRTALFVIYPLMLFLFYSNLSLRTLLRYAPILVTLGLVIRAIAATVAQTAFGAETQGEGTLGWRVEQVWIPAFTYGSEVSPLLGFGVRGWEYVCNSAGILNAEGQGQSPHNIYLWLFISWGLVGLVIHLILWIILAFHSFHLAQVRDRKIAIYAKAAFCSLIAYLIWASISNANIDIGWLIMILIASSIAALSVMMSRKTTLVSHL